MNFEIGALIGKGGHARVYKGTSKCCGSPVVMKVVNGCSPQSPADEVKFLKRLKRISGVVQIVEFSGRTIVMEPTPNAVDLFDYVCEKKRVNERDARHIFSQVVSTLMACHRAGVMHLDIKDENILLDRETLTTTLIDFGGAQNVTEDPIFQNWGTAVYNPPEIHKKQRYNGLKLEAWSLGILLYNMVCGDVPFQNEEEVLMARVVFGAFRPSEECRDLIEKCLTVNPSERLTFEEIVAHPWMQPPICV